jgi:type IV secretion system protein VirB4
MRARERLLREYVPWRDFLFDNVILHTDHSVSMTLQVEGVPFETMDDHIINYRHDQLEAAIRDVGQDGVTFHFLQCRGAADPGMYPEGRFSTDFCERLDAKYKAKLFGSRGMWFNQSYLTIQLSPRQIPVFGRFRPQPDPTDPPQQRMRRLQRLVGIFCEHMKDCKPRILGLAERNNRLFNEVAEAIAFAMTGYWRPVPFTVGDAVSVFSEKFIVGRETFEVRMPHKSSWGACLGMDEFPYMTEPGMLDAFLSAGYRHTVMHAYRCLPSIDGQALVLRKQNRMRHSGDRAIRQAEELDEAANLIASGRLAMGGHANVLTVFADNPAQLSDAIQSAWGDFSTGGIKVEREDITLEGALFSMIPGNFHLRGRDAGISSRNFAAFASFHNFPSGVRKGHWGQPLAILRNSGGAPFNFHLHHGGVGNTLVSGHTGAGKTTLLGFVICQSERSRARVILWDKDRGLESLVRAVEGNYLPLVNTPGLGSGVAPLKRLSGDDPEDMAALAQQIRACAATPDPYKFTPEEDRRLYKGLREVMKMPPEDRWLEDVRAFLGTSRDGAGARLEKWCWGQEFGWIIDCPKDIVDFDCRVNAFDQSQLLTDPIAAGAIMAALFYYTTKQVDGRPTILMLDEVWNAFQIEQFNWAIKNAEKTWRKYDAPVILGTQDPADFLKSPIGDTIRTQTPTQIYFSDPGAVWDVYGPAGMHRTETEYDIIRKLPKGTGHFLLVQGDRSDVVQVPLSGLEDEIAVISGTKSSVGWLDKARQRSGEDRGTSLVDEFLRVRKEEMA